MISSSEYVVLLPSDGAYVLKFCLDLKDNIYLANGAQQV